MVEILPGIMPKVIARVADALPIPLICGGLVMDKSDVMEALNAGALAYPPPTRRCGGYNTLRYKSIRTARRKSGARFLSYSRYMPVAHRDPSSEGHFLYMNVIQQGHGLLPGTQPVIKGGSTAGGYPQLQSLSKVLRLLQSSEETSHQGIP